MCASFVVHPFFGPLRGLRRVKLTEGVESTVWLTLFYGSISFGQLSNSGYIVFGLLLIGGELHPPYRHGAKYNVVRM